MEGAWCFEGSCASGTVPLPAPFSASTDARRPDSSSTPIVAEQLLKKLLLHFVESWVQMTSSPLPMVSAPQPCQIYSSSQALIFDFSAFWLRPNVVGGNRRAVSLAERMSAGNQCDRFSSFMAMRLNVSRISLAAAMGSGLPFGPSGFT